MNFLGSSSRYAVFESPFKGQHRVYLVDLHTKEVKWLNFLNKVDLFEGDYELQRIYKNVGSVVWVKNAPNLHVMNVPNVFLDSTRQVLVQNRVSPAQQIHTTPHLGLAIYVMGVCYALSNPQQKD